MFINTHSREAMVQGICNYFKINSSELAVVFEEAEKKSLKEHYLDGEIFNNIINNFVDKKMPNICVDQVLFFHLSRRLNSTKDNHNGKNLYDLLSTENEITEFLKNHDVEFVTVDRHFELIYKGREVPLTDSNKVHVPYLRRRLGYNVNCIDYCFNGFLLKDILHKNAYAKQLFRGPEFMSVLASFLKREDILTDYFENSKYYCFEYCIPLETVRFDSDENLTDKEKPRYLLNQILYRLYDYSASEGRKIFDYNNPIMRLKENDTMDEQSFISIEEITEDKFR
nr:hypothetical protein [uncultured Acetobacterium sp.]